jgi:hypothetical protein
MWLLPSPWPGTTKLCSREERGGKAVDGVTEVKYGQKQNRRGFFINMTTVWPASSHVGRHTETSLESAKQSIHPSRETKRARWQEHRIIQAEMGARYTMCLGHN